MADLHILEMCKISRKTIKFNFEKYQQVLNHLRRRINAGVANPLETDHVLILQILYLLVGSLVLKIFFGKHEFLDFKSIIVWTSTRDQLSCGSVAMV